MRHFLNVETLWCCLVAAAAAGLLLGSQAKPLGDDDGLTFMEGLVGDLGREENFYSLAAAHVEHLTSDVGRREADIVTGEPTLVLLDGALVNARRIFWFEAAILEDLSQLLALPKEKIAMKYLDISGSRYKAVVELSAGGHSRAAALVDALNEMMKNKDECIEWTVLEYATIRVIPDFDEFMRAERWHSAVVYSHDKDALEVSSATRGLRDSYSTLLVGLAAVAALLL